jgi:hypothetical protein
MSFAITAIAAAGASIAGTAISFIGQRNAATAANQTAKYNAQIQRSQAVQETEVAKENARRKQRENSQIIGRQRAMLAQSGLAMEGTPLAVLGETAMTLQRDILDLGYDAATRARALKAGASMSIWEGKQQASAMKTASVGTAISGVTSATTGYLTATGKIP